CLRGIQGAGANSESSIITDNVFETRYGIASTNTMPKLTATGNKFACSDEAVGLGTGVSSVDGTDIIDYFYNNNVFAPGKAPVIDYRSGTATPIAIPAKVHNETQKTGYASIQEAIEAAKEGDTIVVDSGTYTENITMKVKGVTLKTAEGAEKTLLNGEIIANADNITVEGFTIDGLNKDRCVQLNGANKVTVKNNVFKNCLRGIQGAGANSESSIITDNVFETRYGIASTNTMPKLTATGNKFACSDEAVGLGTGVSVIDDSDVAAYFYKNNTFIDGKAPVIDYRSGTATPVKKP
ncbi:MAG TPA: hypothetical protein DDZ89_18930, partial [Clostridiales bacterium]|nr:hypothetical protein [Clostridiales bacterium]